MLKTKRQSAAERRRRARAKVFPWVADLIDARVREVVDEVLADHPDDDEAAAATADCRGVATSLAAELRRRATTRTWRGSNLPRRT